MKTTEYCLLAANELKETGDTDYAQTAAVLDLIAEAYSEYGIDHHQSRQLERVHSAMDEPISNTPYCGQLPTQSPYYELTERLADMLLGETLPIEVRDLNDYPIIPANELIHKGMLINLAANLIHEHGAILIEPSPIRNRIMELYARTTEPPIYKWAREACEETEKFAESEGQQCPEWLFELRKLLPSEE